MRTTGLGFVAVTLTLLVICFCSTPVEASPWEVVVTQQIGGATGTPEATMCSSGQQCTYYEYGENGLGLVVPFDGTIVDFSVNSGTAPAAVRLVILRPEAGRLTVAAVGGQQMLTAVGVNTFTTAVPVRRGDVLGLEDESGAQVFAHRLNEGIGASAFEPFSAEGGSVAPDPGDPQLRLLLTASDRKVVPADAAPAAIVGPAMLPLPPVHVVAQNRPTVSSYFLTHRVFRVRAGAPVRRRSRHAPRGTAFDFVLSEPASARLTLSRRIISRRRGSCASRGAVESSAAPCVSWRKVGELTYRGIVGENVDHFDGVVGHRALPAGIYRASLVASAPDGRESTPIEAGFRIAP